MDEMTDTDLMPFGVHKGQTMEAVPASYFNWLWCNGMKENKTSAVADYIRRNLSALQQENRDLIWD